MALLICPDCRKEVSGQSSHCIHCGCPLPHDGAARNNAAKTVAGRVAGKLIGGLGSLAIAAAILYFALGADFVKTWLQLRAPSCGDEDVKRTALEVVETQLLPDILSPEALSEITLALKMVRTTALDDKLGSHTCAANLSMVGPEGLTMETPITYSSMLGEKRGEFMVSVDFDRPEDVLSLSPEYQRQQELERQREAEREKREQFQRELNDLNNFLKLFE